MTEPLCSLSRYSQQPLSRGPAAALPTSRYAHRARFRNMMRPTGEASRPVSGDLVCRLLLEKKKKLGENSVLGQRTVREISSGIQPMIGALVVTQTSAETTR